MKNKKAFTIIELVAVLVILAILALIVTPIVMNIISKAKDSANKRSIDAYGRSIELAIASHLIETGNFPTSIEELTIEYNGDEVVCETTQLNSDSSVYLAGCTVGGRSVEGYTYGKTDEEEVTYDYKVGDEVTYNGVDYYVIEDSTSNQDYVKLWKKTILTDDEINLYGGFGTSNNHVNRESAYSNDTMPYYSGENCEAQISTDGCKNSYDDSDVKYVVDAWANDKVKNNIKSARLITAKEYIENLTDGDYDASSPSIDTSSLTIKYDWVRVISDNPYENNKLTWTMTAVEGSSDSVIADGVWYGTDCFLCSFKVCGQSGYNMWYGAVRPLVELYKNDNLIKK